MKNEKKIIQEIKKFYWKKEPYVKQNWGNWFHSISAYVGRIKPAFAHWLIKIATDKNDIVLDPFCGVGTVLLECDLLERKSIGIDLSSYAYRICLAKKDRIGLTKEIEYLNKIKLKYSKNVSSVPQFVKEFYHQKTLKEIIELRDLFLKDKKDFLLGCLLGIVHGHRNQHLSMRTGYIIPYIPKPKPEIVYKNSIDKLKEKVQRMYKDQIKGKSKFKVYNKNILNTNLKDNSVDIVISSPPYYNTIDYVHANRLRLWFSGVNFDEQKKLTKELIQDRYNYETEMTKVGKKLFKCLKKNSLLIFVLGDVHFSKNNTVNTATVIEKIYLDLGFKKKALINDEIPANRTTIVKFKGQNALDKKKQKFDRILVMSK
jgi:DNA modification methylase